MLSAKEIMSALGKEVSINPFREDQIGPASYDLTSSQELTISPHHWQLTSTSERVSLGIDLAASLFIRSSFAREGLFASLALVDPGFDGNLTISIFNGGDKDVVVHKGERFLQISFFRLGTPTNKPYAGRYQHSLGTVESRREKS